MKLADLIRTLPAILDSATRQQRNVIVRPYALGVSFIQLDDLRADMLTQLINRAVSISRIPRRDQNHSFNTICNCGQSSCGKIPR
jgi:hypothetical protein